VQSEKVNYLAKFEPLISLFMVSLSTCLEKKKRTIDSSKTHTHHLSGTALGVPLNNWEIPT
jgi:hypothetical protein